MQKNKDINSEIKTEGWKHFIQEIRENDWKQKLHKGKYAVDRYVRSWQSERSDYETDTIFDEIISQCSHTGIANVGLNSAAVELIKARDVCCKQVMTEAQRVQQSAAKRKIAIHFFAYHIAMGRLSDDAEEWLPCSCCGNYVCTRSGSAFKAPEWVCNATEHASALNLQCYRACIGNA